MVRFLDGRNNLEPFDTKPIGGDGMTSIQYDGEKFTVLWDMLTLPADQAACEPFWQVALASQDDDCLLGTLTDGICLLTPFSTVQNIGAINPAATSICEEGSNIARSTPSSPVSDVLNNQ